MKMQRTAFVLTAINIALLFVTLTQAVSSEPEATPVLRARAFELVDVRGTVRSRLNVEADGTVVLRLLDQDGVIRVKLGADKDGAGLVLLDEKTEPGVHLLAGSPKTGIILKNKDGQRVIEPGK
jgi:hypothetical protein